MNRNSDLFSHSFRPDHVPDYFKEEWFILILVTVSGLIYNVGLLAGPWFEGKLAECLYQILKGNKTYKAMLTLVVGYVIAISVVQIARYIKRFYVRRFANNVNRRMKEILYSSLVRKSRQELEQEGEGNLITKAISDVDDCVEGMRKFTTEIFDTGVAMIGYVCMLLYYDWRLGLLCLIFPPISFTIAEKLKVIIQKNGAIYKKKTGELSSMTLDRVTNAITYRVYGCEPDRIRAYEDKLCEYEKAAIRSNIWSSSLQPLYQMISMASVIFILYFGSANVLHHGWSSWSIASFTTFLACYTKLSVKSSKTAKLFNAVQKAQVSWRRIKPFMEKKEEDQEDINISEISICSENICQKDSNSINLSQIDSDRTVLKVSDLSFAYPSGEHIFSDISFDAVSGQIIGVTGPVASGKSTFGKTFLCEYPYEGSICINGTELRNISQKDMRRYIAYLGHDPELQNDTIENNLLMIRDQEKGTISEQNVQKYLSLACFDREVASMEDGSKTTIGSEGVRLSGGQAQRLAMARTMLHKKPILILDDPFSALDRETEAQLFRNLKKECSDSIILLISHRLGIFPSMDKIIWMERGESVAEKASDRLGENTYRKIDGKLSSDSCQKSDGNVCSDDYQKRNRCQNINNDTSFDVCLKSDSNKNSDTHRMNDNNKNNGHRVSVGTHEELMECVPLYRELYLDQEGGASSEE